MQDFNLPKGKHEVEHIWMKRTSVCLTGVYWDFIDFSFSLVLTVWALVLHVLFMFCVAVPSLWRFSLCHYSIMNYKAFWLLFTLYYILSVIKWWLKVREWKCEDYILWQLILIFRMEVIPNGKKVCTALAEFGSPMLDVS